MVLDLYIPRFGVIHWISFNIEIVKICPWKKLWRFWLPEFNQNIVRVSLIGSPWASFSVFWTTIFVMAPFWASERRFVVVVVPLRIPLWYPSGIVQKLFIVMTCNRGSLRVITSLYGFYSHLFNSVDKVDKAFPDWYCTILVTFKISMSRSIRRYRCFINWLKCSLVKVFFDITGGKQNKLD